MSDKPIAVVAGGAGFIGSFLCEALLKEGKRVICIDNFSTSHVRNIEPYLRHADFQFLRLDINEPIDLESFAELEPFKVKFSGVQEIYHLAVPTSIKHFDDYRIQTLLSSSIGTKNILDLAVKYKARVLLASSSVVYGGRTKDVTVFQEDYRGIVDHLTPRACYDEGKRFAETMFYTYAQAQGVESRIARIFRTYGPRMPLFDGHQIPDFIMSALNDEEVVINGNKDFKTSMVYVTDVVDGLMRLMKAKSDPGPVNIGSDVDLLLADVAKKIVEMSNSSSEIIFKDELLFLTEIGLPSIVKVKEKLSWFPVVLLDDGLKKTIDYIRANKILLTNGS
ncbi:NAD-dependent epimerase/dehydratase family protein [Candidatus Uhrbacteria bacterium]|jgi:UDP-glucuronate decarboxylase|nr:NAD-dependent epimerase/dehydratase family protein [Candidatus Uhrbacteria bacterium]